MTRRESVQKRHEDKHVADMTAMPGGRSGCGLPPSRLGLRTHRVLVWRQRIEATLTEVGGECGCLVQCMLRKEGSGFLGVLDKF